MGIFDKAKDVLHSDKVEELSDKVLDKVEDLAGKALGEDKAAQVADIREKLDEQLGNE